MMSYAVEELTEEYHSRTRGMVGCTAGCHDHIEMETVRP